MKRFTPIEYALVVILMMAVGCGSKEDADEAIYKDLRQNMHWSFEKSPLSRRCYEMVFTYRKSGGNVVVAMNEVTCEEAKLR